MLAEVQNDKSVVETHSVSVLLEEVVATKAIAAAR